MRLSQLISRTSKQISADEVSVNAKLLIRAGYIDKVMAGVYSYLPLGKRVLDNISNIIRGEMDAIGGQEVTMPVLHPKENWEKTGRWRGLDVLFKVKSHAGELAMGPSHEEIVVPMTQKYNASYMDFPKYVYQIQTKFRDEPRAKSGLLRGREFLMKDLYSFHTDKADFEKYYKRVQGAYEKIFKRCSVKAILTDADGGTFSEFSHEYQVLTDNGEDEIIYCPGGDFSENIEITKVKEGKQCDLGHGKLKRSKSIEVGNIFPLKDKYSKAFNYTFKDKDGKEKPVLMGCYGIGISRLMGAIVEVYNDDKGMMWPKEVAPYQAQLVDLGGEGEIVYEKLTKAGIDVLFDDRKEESAGEKFADCDLIGVPVRLVTSKKTGRGKVEVKKRNSDKVEIISIDELISRLS